MKLYIGHASEDRNSATAIAGGLNHQHIILDAFDILQPGQKLDDCIRACAHEADRIIVLWSTTFEDRAFRDSLLDVAVSRFRADPNAVAAILLDGARTPDKLHGCQTFLFANLIQQNFAPLRKFLETSPHKGAIANPAQGEPSAGRPRTRRTTRPPTPVSKDASQALRLLQSVSQIPIKEKCVIRNYFRWAEEHINNLKVWAGRIKQCVKGDHGSVNNFPIGGSPGTGKTFFAAQIAAELGDTVAYHQLDFSNNTAAEVKATVEQVRQATRPAFLIIDEVDTPSADPMLYAESFQILEVNQTGAPRVCILLGSSKGGYHSFVNSLIARPPKYCDFGTRIGMQNGFNVPEAILGDRLAILTGQIQMLMPTAADSKRIEKFAAYYILTDPHLGNPRAMRNFIAPAIERFQRRGGDRGILFEDLFPLGEARARKFLTQHQSIFDMMQDTYVRFE